MSNNQLYTGEVTEINLDSTGKIENAILKTSCGKEYILLPNEISPKLQTKIKIGHRLDFVILHDNIISIKKALPLRRDKVVKMLNSKEGAKGIITSIYSWGAFISVDGYNCVMMNADFSVDHTTIGAIHKEGDLFSGLRLLKITSSNSVYVMPEQKRKSDVTLGDDLIKKGTIIFGAIKNIKKFEKEDRLSCFVGVANDLNLLTPFPDFDVKEDDRVVCRVSKMDEAEGILRGEIIKLKA